MPRKKSDTRSVDTEVDSPVRVERGPDRSGARSRETASPAGVERV